jgi:hypothetical protein
MSREVKLLTFMPPQFAGLVRACEQANTPLACAFLERYAEVMNDVGDAEQVAVTKRSEARDFAALDILIEVMISDAVAGKLIDIGGLTQAMNTKGGKARVLGLERKPKRVRTLREVMNGTVTPIKGAP